MSIFLILGLLFDVGVVFSIGNNNLDKICSVTASGDNNVPPVVEVVPAVSSGRVPLTVSFSGEAYDEDGEIFSLEWDFEGDGVFEVVQDVQGLKGSLKVAAVKNVLLKEYTYTKPGIFHALLRVTDDKGESAVSSVTIQAYSDVPRLDVVPCNKKEFEYMAQAGYEAFFTGIGENVQFQIGDADGKLITVKIDNQLKNHGEYDVGSCTVSINFQKSGKVTDVGLILAHEISHATLTISKKYRHIDMPEQEKIIYGVQYSYMTALRYVGVEYSTEYSDHVFRMRNYYNPQGEHHVPISQILRRWLPPTSPVIF